MKNFLRVTVLAICAIFMVANVSAQVITAKRASEIANQFFANGKQKSAAFRSTNATLTKSIDSRAVTGESNDAPTFHILTGANGKGFVIVSGEETENPIIGYSLDGTIDTNNLPDGFVGYMSDIDAQVRALREYNADNPQKAAARSAMQKAADYEYNATSMGNIVKNLNTAPWGQHGPFNNLCKTTDGQTALTGCGPTAFAILCYYYKWPASGVGTVTHQGTGENMELGHTYDYASMRNDDYRSGYTEAEANAVAVLMRDLGWANQVGYGTVSTSFSETGQHMVDHFRFKSERPVDHGASLAVVRSTLGNDTQWKTYIKNCLDAGYPIPYASTTNTSNSARHIYILDGYTDNDYYHFNWGWSGQGNGWFTLDNMVPDDYSNYSNSHKAYFNLIPDATTYTVTATATPSNMGTVSINGGTAGSTVTANLMQGVTATLTAHPADGYALANWTKNGVVVGSRNTIEVTVGTDANDYVANFDDEANVLVVKDYVVNTTNGSLNNGSNKSSIWTSTDNQPTLTLKTTADNDVVVEGMSVSSGNHKFYATAYDVNATKAYTNVTYTLSVPEGYVIKDYTMTYIVRTANQISLNGELLTSTGTFELSATPNAQTASFTLSVSSAGQQYITSKSIAVTVQSEGGSSTPTTYTIAVTAGEGGTATINGNSSATVTESESVTLAATAANGYTFTGWYKGAEKVSGDANYTFSPTESASYEARFVAKAVSNCNIPTDNTLRYYRFAIAIAKNSYTTDFGSNYENVKKFWQECEDFMNKVYVPLGMCFDVIIDQRLLLGTDLPDNNGLPGISGVTDLINNAIGSGSYDVGLCISYRDDSEENTGLSAVNGAYTSTTKANGYAQADKWVVAHEAGHLFGADHTTEGESSLMDNIGEFFSYPSIKKIRDASVNNGPGNAYKSQVVANNAPTFTAQMKKTYRIPKGACLSIPVYASDADGHSLRYAAIGCSSSTVGNITGGGTMPHFASLKPQTSNIIDYRPKFVADGDSYYLPVDGTNIPSMNAGSYSIAILVNDMPEGNSYDYLNSNPFYSNYDVWDATVEIVDGNPFTASISPAQNSYTAGSNVTVTWGVNNSVFTEDSRVRITMSTDYGKTFTHVLADDVRALDGSKAVTLPNVNVGNVDVDFSTQYVSAVRSMRAGIIRVEVIDGAAYTLTTLSPENGGGFNITGGGAEPDPTPVTYAITTAANPAEGGTAKFAVGTGSQKTEGDVNSGELITLYATANTGYNFVNWTLNGTEVSTDATCNVTASQDANYVANFEAEAAEPEQPEFDGTKKETSYTDANWFRNNKGTDIGYGTESWGYKVVTENEISTVTLMVKDKDNSGYYKNNLGFRNVNGVNHPFLFKGTTFTISVPEQHKITGYSMTVVGENFNAGTVTYTTGAQMARSNTSTATISGTNPTTLNATGLDTNSIEITLGSATASTAGVTITDLDIYYKAYEPEYTLGDRLTYAQLMSVTKPTHIAVKNLSKTNNWYFAGTTNVENFGNEAVFVWTPKTEGVAGEYYLKTLDGKYLGAAGDNTPISYTEDVANAAVFTTLKPVAGNTDTSRLDKDSDTGDYVDNDNLLVRFMTKYSGGTGDVTTWINVTNTTSPNQPKYYNGGYGMYTAHFVYAVSVDGVAPEIPDVLFPDGAYKIYWQADNRGYLAYHATDYPNEAKLAGVTYSGCQDIHYAVNEVDLVWYLITADDGKRYLFQAATGKFLGANPSINENGIANKLSTTEAWPIAIEENTKHTGHYIITTEINGTNNLLCSGCGTPKEQHPVRWLTVNDNNQTDGGAPLQLIPVNDVTVADNVMNAVLAVINGTDEPEQPTDPLAGKYFRLKEKSTGNYMNIANTSNNTDSTSGVTVVAKNESSNNQIFLFEQSGDGYKLKANCGNYIKCHNWNANANTTDANEATVLTFEPTANELEYLIKWDNKNKDSNGIELDDYFKVQNVGGTYYVFDDAALNAAATWVLEEVVMQRVYFKAEIENWRNDNPNTHLGTITIGGTAMKLTPAHQTASELTMPVVEGTALAFTRKYRGFEFNGFYIGSTSIGENPTLTADNVAAIDENNPLIAKFTATDDVTLFYDDDEFSYRIPAIAKTGTNRLVAVSDYRHSLDDIGRDQHHTGTNRVDLVMRTSDDNGLTWSAKQTIAEGTSTFGYGDAAIAANGEDILVMAVAGNVFYPTATAISNNKTYRIYSNNNGASWTKEEVTSNIFGLFDEAYATFFGSGKLAVDPDFNGTGKARVYGAILLKNSARSTNNYVLFSDDWGATWNILGGSKTQIAEADEPKVEILPNGQILLSSRHASGGSRVFNVFTYGNDKAAGEGTWGTAVSGCSNGGSNGTNGEIICLDAKQTNGKPTKILLQSQPQGGSSTWDRKDVTIWYKEIGNETQTPSSIASDWTKGKQVSTVQSAYSAMALQENGEIALFFEEAPCYGDDNTKGYSMVYVPLTIEEITENNFLNPNADVEYVPAEFNIVLTDAQDNEYRETLDYTPADVAAVESYLTTTYPFITLGTTGAIADNTYTNSVTLPFKVSNSENAYWHNIYWPANGTSAGEFYPIYLKAETEDATYITKLTEYGKRFGESQYNTYEHADKLGWAVYSVNNTLTFKFKNKLTGKFMAVNGVVSNGNADNVIFTDEAGATVFTLEKYTGANTAWGDYGLKSVYNGTTGYVCNTSAGYANATNYTGTGHPGAWVEFGDADYDLLISNLDQGLILFGNGNDKRMLTTEIQAIIDAMGDYENPLYKTMLLKDLKAHFATLENAINNWPKISLTIAPVGGGTTKIAGEANVTSKYVPTGQLTVEAVHASGYRFTHWSNGTTTVSTDASYTFNINAATELTANFEIEEGQEGLTTGYYHLVSRATGRHEHLYNNAFSSNNTNGYTLQSDNMVNTNNGIWYITVNNKQLDIKNGDGKPVVAGNSYNNGIMGTYSSLNIHTTIEADGYTYYYFSEALNCSDSGQNHFKVGGINYLTTWSGHPEATDNQWRLERVDTDGKNIYNVVVECTNKEDVYVVYGSGTNEEYAFNGGFFITDATITAQQLTANAAQGVTVLVEGNTIRVVDTEYVDITVSASPAEGGTVTINSEATSTKQVVKSSNVTVEATPASGYNFVNWTDAEGNAVSTDATYTFTASENTSLVANFEADVVYHTITVSTYYNNNGGTVKVGEEDATSVNVAEGESVRMLATVADGYEFMGWLKDGVIVKNAINGGLDFEVQGPDYTLYEVKASAEYVAVFSKITDYTNLEDGKAYRICGVQGNGQARCIYRDGNTLKWKYDYDNNDVKTIFVAQKNGNAMNLISAVGYHGWKASYMLGNDEQYNPYAAIKVTYGTRDELRTLYIESGTSSGLFQTNINGAFSFQNSRGGGLSMVATDEITTDFLFVEVDAYAFQVSAADGSNAKLGTVNLPFATTVPAEVTVYGVNDSNEDYVYVAPLELTDNVLPANTPVLIEATASGKYGFKPAPASANVYDTGFAGTLEAEDIPGTTKAYILSYNGAGTTIKMYRLSSTERTINANKAYFIDSTGRALALQFVFGGTTDIEEVEREGLEDTIYDLQGRKLSEITEPGMYIINGKKVYKK